MRQSHTTSTRNEAASAASETAATGALASAGMMGADGDAEAGNLDDADGLAPPARRQRRASHGSSQPAATNA